LYRYHPYNRSVWSKLRDPVWIILTLVSCCQYYGIRAGFFVLLFLLIDKRDEFQLVQFIWNFKGTQFVSGIIAAFVGAAQFFYCVGFEDPFLELGSETSCASLGPGVSLGEQSFIISMATFATHVLLTWISFLLLPCTVRKGRVLRLADEADAAPEGCCGDAGRAKRLRKLLVYDLLSFFLSMGMFAGCLAAQGQLPVDLDADTAWLIQVDLYWAKVLYLVLAFPFFVLTLLPIFTTVVLHTRPTGYNPYGYTVPMNVGDEWQKVRPGGEDSLES
jgi:hypothetical protein